MGRVVSLRIHCGMCGLVMLALSVSPTSAGVVIREYVLDTPASSSSVQMLNGLRADVRFTWDDAKPTELVIDLTNTSTGVPAGFDSADQLLTAISFDFGDPGFNGDPMIIGGSVLLAPGGTSYDMDTLVTGGDDLSGEWGFGNMNGTGLLTNFVSATGAQATPFGGANLDGPVALDGPQGGISTDPPLIAMGGIGAVADSIIITLQLDTPLTGLNFLDENGVMAEFGSDAAHLVPEPSSLALLVLGALALIRRGR